MADKIIYAELLSDIQRLREVLGDQANRSGQVPAAGDLVGRDDDVSSSSVPAAEESVRRGDDVSCGSVPTAEELVGRDDDVSCGSVPTAEELVGRDDDVLVIEPKDVAVRDEAAIRPGTRREKKRPLCTAARTQEWPRMPVFCPRCPREFETVKEMAKHFSGHGGRFPWSCPACPAHFRKITEQRAHLWKEHWLQKIFTCHLCDKGFYDQKDLTPHLKMHAGGFLYECPACPQKFRVRRELTEHLPVHVRKFN